MVYVDVFHILAYAGAFDVILFEVRRRHDNHIRFNLHHQRDQTCFIDIIRDDPLLFALQNGIVRRARYIMNLQLRIPEYMIDDTGEIFVVALSLCVKHQLHMFEVVRPAESFVILFRQFFVSFRSFLFLAPFSV